MEMYAELKHYTVSQSEYQGEKKGEKCRFESQ